MLLKIMKRNRIWCYFVLSESFVRMSDTDPDTEVGEAIRNPYRPALLFLSWTFIDLILWDSQGSATLVITHKQCCVSESEIRCLFDPYQCLFIKTLDPGPLEMLDLDTNSLNPDPQHCLQKSLFFLVICGSNYNFWILSPICNTADKFQIWNG
jgi:hypothetical protein